MKIMPQKHLMIMVAVWAVVLVVSGIGAHEMGTWVLEVLPVVIGSAILLYTNKKFPLPYYVMIWIFIHGLVLMLGGHYTYAKVPVGFWLQDLMHLERNPYDRIGHLFQGFVPALIAKEILIRDVKIESKKWIAFLVVCICLSISVAYEFIEWGAAVISGEGAEAFLGTQGDVWDSHWDMLLAGIGAVLALLIYCKKWDSDPT